MALSDQTFAGSDFRVEGGVISCNGLTLATNRLQEVPFAVLSRMSATYRIRRDFSDYYNDKFSFFDSDEEEAFFDDLYDAYTEYLQALTIKKRIQSIRNEYINGKLNGESLLFCVEEKISTENEFVIPDFCQLLNNAGFPHTQIYHDKYIDWSVLLWSEVPKEFRNDLEEEELGVDVFKLFREELSLCIESYFKLHMKEIRNSSIVNTKFNGKYYFNITIDNSVQEDEGSHWLLKVTLPSFDFVLKMKLHVSPTLEDFYISQENGMYHFSDEVLDTLKSCIDSIPKDRCNHITFYFQKAYERFRKVEWENPVSPEDAYALTDYTLPEILIPINKAYKIKQLDRYQSMHYLLVFDSNKMFTGEYERMILARSDFMLKFFDPNCFYSDDADHCTGSVLSYIAISHEDEVYKLSLYSKDKNKSLYVFTTSRKNVDLAIWAVWAYFSSMKKNKREGLFFPMFQYFGIKSFRRYAPPYNKFYEDMNYMQFKEYRKAQMNER